MSSGKSDNRPVPASIWWCIVLAAYSWGYSEGRRKGQWEGYAQAVKAWTADLRGSLAR